MVSSLIGALKRSKLTKITVMFMMSLLMAVVLSLPSCLTANHMPLNLYRYQI